MKGISVSLTVILLAAALLNCGCFPSSRSIEKHLTEESLRWEPLTKMQWDQLQYSRRLLDFPGMGLFSSAENYGYSGTDPGEVIDDIRDRNHKMFGFLAAEILAEIGRKDPGKLIPYLDDKDDIVVQNVISALRDIGPDAQDASGKLRELMSHDSPYVRGAAAEALLYIGDDTDAASQTLIQLAKDNNSDIKWRAVGALWAAPADDGITKIILGAAYGADDKLRKAAIDSLGGLPPDDEIIAAIVNGLDDEDSLVRAATVSALYGDNKGPAAAAALIVALDDADVDVRINAVWVLNDYSGEEGVIEALAKTATSDTEPRVRAQALSSLEYLGPDAAEALPAIHEALADESPEVIRQASSALKAISPEGEDLSGEYAEMLKDDNPGTRVVAIHGIADLGEEKVAGFIPLLTDALGDDAPSVRSTAAETLARYSSQASEALDELSKLLTDEDVHARVNAANAVYKISGDAKSTVPVLVNALGDADYEVRHDAAYALSDFGPAAADAVRALIKALADEVPFVSSYAAEALGEIGPAAKDAVPILVKMMSDDDVFNRRDSTKALGKIGYDDGTVVPALINMMNDERLELRAAAISSLKGFAGSDDRIVPALVKALDDDSEQIRMCVIYTLGFAKKSDDIKALLMKGLEDDSESIRLLSAISLYRLDPDNYDDSWYPTGQKTLYDATMLIGDLGMLIDIDSSDLTVIFDIMEIPPGEN